MTIDRQLLIDYIRGQITTLDLYSEQLGEITYRNDDDNIVLTLGDKSGEAAWVDNYENDRGICIHAEILIVSASSELLVEHENALCLEDCSIVALRRIANYIHEVTMSIFDYKKGK